MTSPRGGGQGLSRQGRPETGRREGQGRVQALIEDPWKEEPNSAPPSLASGRVRSGGHCSCRPHPSVAPRTQRKGAANCHRFIATPPAPQDPSPAQSGPGCGALGFGSPSRPGRRAVVLIIGSVVKNRRRRVPAGASWWRSHHPSSSCRWPSPVSGPRLMSSTRWPDARRSRRRQFDQGDHDDGGYLVALFLALGLTDYPLGHLLLGGAIVGVILGLRRSRAWATSSLVSFCSRPSFTVGNYIRVEIGSTGR